MTDDIENAKSLRSPTNQVCEQACREMTVRECLEQKCKDLQHQAYQINELIKALPTEMSHQAESALRKIIRDSK